MKIRIKGNSLRIRINKPEVDAICRGEQLVERALFPNGTLTYVLEKVAAGSQLTADLHGSTITMQVPESLATGWDKNDVVGFSHYLPLPGGDQLFLLLEKDFKCIDNTMMEDQSNNFDNPNHVCS